MGYLISYEEFDEKLLRLSEKYRIYAPVKLEAKGRFSDTSLIKYREISSAKEIEYREKSTYSPKDIIFPITQRLFTFTGNDVKESEVDSKGIIIFLRPCDINGVDRLDGIFLRNGPYTDIYYKRLREKVKYVMMECRESFDNCFCVSMGTNNSSDYAMAVRFGDKLKVEIKDKELETLFADITDTIEFLPEFVRENKINVRLPNVETMPASIYEDKMWEEYNRRCIACGRCNTACITCSCFTTRDIAYEDNPDNGERRRVWAGCHIDKFTDMAGGHGFRKKYGARMRFKTMHKIYDYKKRFGDHMCVGCGRCDDICPEYISFSNAINKLSDKLKEEKTNE